MDEQPQPGILAKIVGYTIAFLRPINFIFGGLTILCGLYNLILAFYVGFGTVFRCFLALFFTTFLGLLMLAGDIPKLIFIQYNCKFLLMTLGRGLFNIFVGAWVYSLWQMRAAGGLPAVLCWIDFVCLAVLGILFIVIHFVVKRKYINAAEEHVHAANEDVHAANEHAHAANEYNNSVEPGKDTTTISVGVNVTTSA